MPINHKKHTAMKRLLIAILLALPLLAAPAQAQTTEEQHLEFMGIPIDGTLNAFARKLQAKGMEIKYQNLNDVWIIGDFAGNEDCWIIPLANTSSDPVWRVSVMLPPTNMWSWSVLEDRYLTFKNMLSRKYGEPTQCIEEFNTTIQPDDDRSKMYHAQMERCNYYCQFQAINGFIELKIISLGTDGVSVALLYTDSINLSSKMDSIMDDL